MRPPLSFCVCALALAISAPAHAGLRTGDRCKATRQVTLKAESGLDTTVSAGDEIEVLKPGRTFTRVLVGDLEGRIATVDLEEICSPARDLCTLQAPIKMTEAKRGKKRAFKIKAGAEVEIVEAGKKRARVRIGNMEGLVKVAELKERCEPKAEPRAAAVDKAERRDAGETKPDGKTTFPDLPPVTPAPSGVKVALLPFAVGPGVDPVAHRHIEDSVAGAFLEGRTDAAAFLEQPGLVEERDRPLKDHLNLARRIGAAMGVDVVLTGRLDKDPKDAKAFSLQLAAVDVKASRVRKGVTLHPTLRPEDPWASAAARVFAPALPKGGARVEAPPVDEQIEAPKEGSVTPSEEAWPDAQKPWFTNTLAYTTLGTAALLAVGGAATGTFAWLDAEAYRAATQAASVRPGLATQSVVKGAVADGLYAAALVLTATTGVLFVTGVDYETFEGR